VHIYNVEGEIVPGKTLTENGFVPSSAHARADHLIRQVVDEAEHVHLQLDGQAVHLSLNLNLTLLDSRRRLQGRLTENQAPVIRLDCHR